MLDRSHGGFAVRVDDGLNTRWASMCVDSSKASDDAAASDFEAASFWSMNGWSSSDAGIT
jgi:hypothetical protein